jgi:hypothetical protein
MTQPNRSSPSKWAQGLGYGGLIPFVGLALAMWLLAPNYHALTASALLSYSATIVSFLGAIHWGLTMRDAPGPMADRLIWGVIPSLTAWVALLLPTAYGLLLIAALLWICFTVDRAVYPRFGIQAWLPMRLVLSVVASLSCVAAAVQLIGLTL